MSKPKYFINWRTAPRSMYILLKWLPIFYSHQDEDYTATAKNYYPNTSPKNKVLHPVRRKITYEYESSMIENPDTFAKDTTIDKFIKGFQPGSTKKDRADKESRVRQVVTTAEQFGLMNSKNAHLTPVGEKVVRKTFDADDLLKQLLKMYLVTNKDNSGVFPFKIFIILLNKFSYLSRNELTFLFGTLNDNDITYTIKAITEFREKYSKLENKNKDDNVKKILKSVWCKYYHPISDKKLFNTIRKDYTDAFTRTLSYTELFYLHGRGTATKVRPTELNKKKLNMLISDLPFKKPPVKSKNVSSRNLIHWYGELDNVTLPWENKEKLSEIVADKIEETYSRLKNIPRPAIPIKTLLEWKKEQKNNELSFNELKEIELQLQQALLIVNKDQYIQLWSKTKENRKEILDRYEAIKNNEDESALWLEVNTWKAFVSLNGDSQEVIPNFNMNSDLTPKSFAPGKNNTPDMEIYFDHAAIIPEVSLMVGTQQWEHEGSSVIDHVYQKIKEHTNRKVLGLFISSSINIRTNWQFFLLNRESWVGAPVPVVPLTINQFVDIITFMYKYDLDIYAFNNLLNSISDITKKLDNYQSWSYTSNTIIDKWKESKGNYIY